MFTKSLLSIFIGSVLTLLFVAQTPAFKPKQENEDSEITKYKECLKFSKEKIKNLNLHKTDRIFDKQLESIKEIKEENKVLKKEKNTILFDTVKILIRDTVYIEKTDTLIKRKKLFGIF